MLRKSSQKTEMKRDRQNRQSFIRKSLVENQCWLMLRFNEPQWKVDLIIEPLYELSIKSDSIRVQIREREKERQSKKSSPHVRWKKIYNKKKTSRKRRQATALHFLNHLLVQNGSVVNEKTFQRKWKKGLNEKKQKCALSFLQPRHMHLWMAHMLWHMRNSLKEIQNEKYSPILASFHFTRKLFVYSFVHYFSMDLQRENFS